MVCHYLLQGIFPTQGSNLDLLGLPHCRQIFYHLSHKGTWEGKKKKGFEASLYDSEKGVEVEGDEEERQESGVAGLREQEMRRRLL